MEIKGIDHGNSFDWGKTSENYAKYRDIYPKEFYDKLLSRKVGGKGQKILDIGTGTGVVPRNMYKFGANEERKHVWVPDEYNKYFDITLQEEFDVKVPFTRERWHGRMRACRGVEASMSEEYLAKWDVEHREMLEKNAAAQFEILHFVSIAELTLK